MNARSTAFEFTCLGKRINEIVSAIFHSVIFNRCFGKFQYKQQNSYSIGTLGFEEIICDFIDFTYIRVASVDLAKTVNNQIKIFVDELRALNNQYSNAANPTNQTGRRPASALFNLDIVPESSQQQKKHKDVRYHHYIQLHRLLVALVWNFYSKIKVDHSSLTH